MTDAGAQVKAVIFDKDGTLLDFGKCWDRAFGVLLRGMCTPAGSTQPEFDRLRSAATSLGYDLDNNRTLSTSPFIAESNDVIAVRLLEWAVSEDALVQAYGAARAQARADISPMDGADSVLRALHADGVLLAVATNDSVDGAQMMIDSFEWADLFGAVVGFDSGHDAKPEPAMVLAAVQQLGVSAEQSIMVGDSSHDIHAGKAAGLTTVLIGDADVPEADHRITRLAQLVPLVAAGVTRR